MLGSTMQLALIFMHLSLGADDSSYTPTVGSGHPDFTLPDTATKKPVSLSDFRGKRVLLIQFASW